MSRARLVAIAVVAMVWIAGAWIAVAASRNCAAAKGTFHWQSLTCTGAEPPLILERGIRRT